MTKHIILFLAANPLGTTELALGREARAIQEELERSGQRDRFEFVTRWAVQPLDLIRELRRLKPTVVHFSGHGGSGGRQHGAGPRRDIAAELGDGHGTDDSDHQGYLFFQGPDGCPQLVTAVALRDTFGAAGTSVKLVVLNACYSDIYAEALVVHIDCVVGMTGCVRDDAARIFAIGFYGGLGERQSVAAAYLQGCAAISLEQPPDDDKPQLRVRDSVDAAQVVLAEANAVNPRRPIPVYQDAEIEQLSKRLEDARARRDKLRGTGIAADQVDREILELRRQLREGGRLRAGDALGDGRYLLVKSVGRGGFAVVWEAYDCTAQQRVAIKVLHTNLAGDPRRRERFFRGAQAMMRLTHPAVVHVLEPKGDDGGFYYFVMEFVPGGNLREVVLENRLQKAARLPLILRIGDALAEAHARGMVHRDIKPANILLDEHGNAKLTDFDLVSAQDTTGGTRTGALGTVVYAAPECLEKPQEATARSDVYGLGMTAIFCLSGRDLSLGTFCDPEPTIAELGLSVQVRNVLTQAVTWDLDKRFADAAAMLLELRNALSLDNRLEAEESQQQHARRPGPAAPRPAGEDRPADGTRAGQRPRRWPWRLAIELGVVGAAAIAAIAWQGRSQPAPYHLEQLTHRGDLEQAVISPDGTQLAFVQGDALVIRGTEPDTEDRVIVDHGIADIAISWSPDGTHLLAAAQSESAPSTEAVLVDIAGGVQFKIPTIGRASFLSNSEAAATAVRRHSIDIYSLASHTAPITTCSVPGDYAFLWSFVGLPDGTLVADTVKGDSHSLVILRRDCRIRATFTGEPISSIAATDTGTIVALVAGVGSSEILEISLDGMVLSRRRISGDVDELLGRRRGTDYVATVALKTHLDRVHGRAAPQRLLSIAGGASFSLSPDGVTVAWVESGTGVRGRLRLSTMENLRRGPPLLDNAVFTGWSPDGQSLAVLVDQGADAGVIVIDRSGMVLRRLPLRHLDRLAAPVWLSDHRIAAQVEDRATYRWFDLVSGEQGDVVDRLHGSTYWLARSPRDGMLAMWRNGGPDASDPVEHLWVQPAGGPPRAVPIHDAIKHFLLPSWSPSGELIVRTLDTGAVSRVALDTGELTPIAHLPRIPVQSTFDDHVMTMADGDLLAVEIERGVAVSAVASDDSPRSRPRRAASTPH